MLIVRRHAGQAIIVAGDVEIEILEITGTQVKLGVTAPRETQIVRKEVVLIRNQNVAASLAANCGLTDWNAQLNQFLGSSEEPR
jgi:carbon storage regulator